MKAFKLVLIFSVAIGIINSAKAQSSFYIRAGAGFGFGLNPSEIGPGNTSSTYGSPTTYTYSNTSTNVQFSPGKGIYPEIAFGYMVTGNVGFELGFSYAYGLSASINSSDNNVDSGYEAESDNSTIKTSFHSFLITPAFVITGNNNKKIVPYARMGLIISIASQLKADETYDTIVSSYQPFISSYSSSGEEVAEVTGTVQLGVVAAAGVTYKLSKHISIFGEINARAFNFKFSQSNLTTYTYNGVNELPTLTTNNKQIDYVNSITTTNNTTYSPGTASQELTALVPASSVGISVGLKIGFGEK
jgi:outer membrane protein W